MNWKKAVTIGLLSITAIGLVGCAVILSKNNPNAKPKVQTQAEDNVTHILRTRDTVTGFTLQGNTEQNAPDGIEYKIQVAIDTRIRVNVNYITYTRINNRTIANTTDNDAHIVSDENETPIKLEIKRQSYSILPNSITQNVTARYDYILTTNLDEYYYNYTLTTNTLSPYPVLTNNNTSTTCITIDLANIITTSNETYEYGYDTGYVTGYQTKGDLADGNFLSLRNTMLSVLTMPFTFINQAFNVTLWEGTPYAFNISNFIKGMIAIAAILFIIRLFTTGFSIIGNYTGGISNSRLDRQQKKANIAKTKAQTAQIGKTKEIHTTSEHTSHVYTHKDK